jgi:hypothetical protein
MTAQTGCEHQETAMVGKTVALDTPGGEGGIEMKYRGRRLG